MNKVVELVNEWDAFERGDPGGDIEGFCRHYLMKKEIAARQAPPDDRPDTPPLEDPDNLMRLMGRILGAFAIYNRSAMAKTRLPFTDAFFFLNTVKIRGEVRKTELVNSMLVEYTTGMETINKLIAEGLVVERADASDRRAKLISISKKGAKVLTECYPYLARVSRMMLKDVDPDGLRLCVRVLSNVELAHSRLAIEMKNRDFDEIYDRIMNAPSA